MRTAVCLYVRNEERDIAEWVVYHSLIGFDAFVIYDNGSDDGTPHVLDRLRRLYNIKVISWPRATKYAQLEAYDDCLKNFRDDFDWIAFVDTDEYIAPIFDGNISRFLMRFQGFNAVALNWSLFGSSGHDAMPDGLNIENFVYRAHDDSVVNRHTKMVVRPEAAGRVNGPHFIAVDYDACAKADGSLLKMQNLGESVDLSGFDVCRVNHYFVRSRAHWKAKLRRGYREGHRSAEQFAAHDLNEVEDTWAAGFAPKIKAALYAIDLLPMRERQPHGPVASSEDEKKTDAWFAVRPENDDILFRFPHYAQEKGNTLFDPAFYLATYPDVRASGVDPQDHYANCGHVEGRRPCSHQKLRAFIASRTTR